MNHKEENQLAVVDNPLDIDNSLVWDAAQPHSTLHNIVSHNIEINEGVDLIEYKSSSETSEQDILKQGDLSSKVMKDIKSATKSKKLMNEEESVPA